MNKLNAVQAIVNNILIKNKNRKSKALAEGFFSFLKCGCSMWLINDNKSSSLYLLALQNVSVFKIAVVGKNVRGLGWWPCPNCSNDRLNWCSYLTFYLTFRSMHCNIMLHARVQRLYEYIYSCLRRIIVCRLYCFTQWTRFKHKSPLKKVWGIEIIFTEGFTKVLFCSVALKTTNVYSTFYRNVIKTFTFFSFFNFTGFVLVLLRWWKRGREKDT